ncbi:hypothetical protein BO70DRAFT_402206 [Aspergillus heteromorphus CBS 117.55]|uniref:Rhodopsin domain-containing protein n=1 Tax=Aspergillus heteromorphus CBS 117.55 TaxID=1448321 RepID=A0A317X6V1_9EURO|nr:uncharacterized protein BO70DRAFT_402206 [Aspergillus heteromorphus CBS 117.55]PWY92300.1 hypothetical protein BO70DRAFT_402206 [Aspergillus heteromorphus CBS 117.55]
MRTIDVRANYPESQVASDYVDGIAIAVLYLMVIMMMAVLIRLSFRLYILRSLQWDDAAISLSLIFAIAQSSAIFQATKQGFGKQQSALSEYEVNTIEKIVYSSDLLYILSLSIAKISVLQLLSRLTVNTLHRRISIWAMILVTMWTIPAFFVLVFRCGIHNPWKLENGHCMNSFLFWVAISPVDIITELIIFILPIYIVNPVQVIVSKKVTVVVAFSFRLFVILTTIIRLIYIRDGYPSPDMTYSGFKTTITTQCVLCVSLMSACIPCLKPFLDAFQTGMLSVTLHHHLAGSQSNSGGNSYALASMGRGIKESARLSRFMGDEAEGLGTSAAAFAVTAPGEREPGVWRDLTMSIQRTDQWSVRHEYVDPKGELVNGLDGKGERE